MALPRRQLANLRLLVICIFLLRSGLAAGRYTDSSGILKQNDHLRLRRRFYDRTLQSSGTPYRVELVLALQYLNDTVASEIESSITIPSNDDAFHFCKSVNHQAGGNQVKQNAKALSATIDTRVIQRGNNYDYECFILATQRSYDPYSDFILGQGFFILEVAVEQLVYVTSANVDQLTLQEVVSIVETGFARGYGGRVKFRSLLQMNPDFATVLNVEVLPNLSSPTIVSSATPIIAQSDSPSASPSGHSSWQLFPAPSKAPNLASSTTPSLSDEPTKAPLGKLSMVPSASPSTTRLTIPITSPVTKANGQTDRQPLILGAIAGGVATILVSCFFIFCVWFPFCSRRKDDEDQVLAAGSERVHRSHPSPSGLSGQYSTSTHVVETMIPGVLTLDDDSRSLANTTVTLGERRSSAASHAARVNQTPTVEPIRILDSFDECSIYTSTFTVIVNERDLFQRGAVSQYDSSIIHSSGNNSIYILKSPVADVNGGEEFQLSVTQHVSTNQQGDNAGDCSIEIVKGVSYDVDPSTLDSGPFIVERQVEDARGSATERSEANDTGSKCFNPFDDDDSSFGFASSVALSDPSFGFSLQNRGFDLSPSVTSTNTKRIEDMFVGVQLTDPMFLAAADSAEKFGETRGWGSGYTDSHGDDDLSRISNVASTECSSNVATANNALLRNILEGARRIAEKKPSSSKSKASLQSAPSRLYVHQTAEVQFKVDSYGHQHAGNQERARNATMSSSRSVDACPQSRFWPNGRAVDSILTLQGNEKVEDGPPTLWQTSLPLPLGENLLVSRLHVDVAVNSMRGKVGIGAQARHQLGGVSLQDEFNTPASSPGLLGIVSQNTDIFLPNGISEGESRPRPSLNTEHHTLGARPRDGGTVSIPTPSSSDKSTNSRNSSRSMGSLNSAEGSRISLQSGQSGISKLYSGKTDGMPSRSTTTDPMINVSMADKQKSADMLMTPRSLGRELMRLETDQYDASQNQTITSSVTDTCASGSRSTLSSRVNATTSLAKRVIVVAPPGKIGVVLANRHDGRGTVVSEVRPSSSMKGMLSPGDKLVAIDGDDVTNIVVSKITSMLASRALQERRLTVITSSPLRSYDSETKHNGNT